MQTTHFSKRILSRTGHDFPIIFGKKGEKKHPGRICVSQKNTGKKFGRKPKIPFRPGRSKPPCPPVLPGILGARMARSAQPDRSRRPHWPTAARCAWAGEGRNHLPPGFGWQKNQEPGFIGKGLEPKGMATFLGEYWLQGMTKWILTSSLLSTATCWTVFFIDSDIWTNHPRFGNGCEWPFSPVALICDSKEKTRIMASMTSIISLSECILYIYIYVYIMIYRDSLLKMKAFWWPLLL